jgi:HEAT repeats
MRLQVTFFHWIEVMLRSKSIALAAVAWIMLMASTARPYVDLAPTLARIVREAETITVVEVVAFNAEKGAVILKKIDDLKGKTGADNLKHQLVRTDEKAMDAPIADWAEPGRRCVVFVTGKDAVVCVGEGWYQARSQDNGWWRIGAPRPDLPLAFYGSVSRLAEALPAILAGKTGVITTLPHGADREGASFDLALNRANLPGLVKVQRLRASNKMPEMAMGVGSNPAFVIGKGRVGKDELPVLRKKLQSEDAAERAEAAIDVGFLGADAADAEKDLAKLLDDKVPGARLSAAAALLRISGKNARAIEVLAKGLTDDDAKTRRHAARATGLAGPAAVALADKLATLLKDDDTRVRRSALQAIATLGPAAAKARESVTALLERPEVAIDAADALGRMGSAARPSLKAMARLLTADAPAERWAAVRNMSLIGGPDAAPAVQFMIKQLPKANEADGYNMLIYLSLLGPVAKDAIPAIRSSRVRNPILRQTATWAIDPTTEPPTTGGFFGDADFAQYIMEAYVQELGDHLKPAAQKLAKKIMTGKAGNVPSWGYKLLARFPDESLKILTPGLADKELVMRERATVAIGYMGNAAKTARPQVAEALKISTDERERLLLQWCLRELD